MLFELLTGERPYDGGSLKQTLTNATQGIHKKDLRALAPKTPEAVVSIVEKLIASDRDARFPNADAVWDAVTEWAIPAKEIRLLGTVVRACRRPQHVPQDGLLTPLDVAEITGAASD